MNNVEPVAFSSIAERNREVVTLQNEGRLEEALKAATEVEQLATRNLPLDDVERAKSICNLGAIQGAFRDPAALATMQRGLEAMRAAVGDRHPLYGRMLGVVASFCEAAGNPAAAEWLAVQAIWILSNAPEADAGHLIQIVQYLAELHSALARKEHEQAVRDLEPAKDLGQAHFDRSLQALAMRKELDRLPPEVGEFARQNLADSSAHLALMTTHQIAEAIVAGRGEHGEPFALLLRGFEGESYDYVIDDPKYLPDGGAGTHTVYTDSGRPSRVEPVLSRALDQKMAGLTVASPASIDPSQVSQGAQLPRLILPNQGWLDTVRSLIRRAHVIVVDCLGLNQGLRLELETIAQCGKTDNTVIALHKDRSELDEIETMARVFADVSGGNLAADPHREWLTRDHPLLAPFSRVVYVDDLEANQSEAMSGLNELLELTPVVRSATRLGKTGTRLANEGKIPEALVYLHVALLLGRDLPGWSERSVLWFNLGVLLRAMNQLDQAVTCFVSAHSAAVALHNDKDEGHSLSMLGAVQLEQGKSDEAREKLVRSLAPLEAAADKTYLARSLRKLIDLSHAAGNDDEAAAAQLELERQETEAPWRREEATQAFKDFFLRPR